LAARHHYDLIVIGHHLAGLVAAALVARRDKRVLVLPGGPGNGQVRLGSDHLPLDTAPCLDLNAPTIRQVFEELGVWQQIRRELRPLRTRTHLIDDSHRVSLTPGGKNLDAEAAREWPDYAATEAREEHLARADAAGEFLAEFLTQDSFLHPDGMWNRRLLARARECSYNYQPANEGDPLSSWLAAVMPWFINSDAGAIYPAVWHHLAGAFARGPSDLADGQSRLREMLIQRISTHAGGVKSSLKVSELHFKRGRIHGLSLLGKRDLYGCEHVLIACDPRRLVGECLPASALSDQVITQLEQAKPLAYRYGLYLEVPEHGLSPVLDGLVIHRPKDVGARGIGTTYMRIQPSRHAGHRWITLTHILAPDASLETQRELLIDRLDHAGILPFVRDHVRALFSPHDGRGLTDGSGQPIRGGSSEHIPHLPMDAIYPQLQADTALHDPSRLALLPHTTAVKNLSLASRLTFPGLGLMGEFAAGYAAASIVAQPSSGRASRRRFR